MGFDTVLAQSGARRSLLLPQARTGSDARSRRFSSIGHLPGRLLPRHIGDIATPLGNHCFLNIHKTAVGYSFKSLGGLGNMKETKLQSQHCVPDSKRTAWNIQND
jgi:hypothetical protein